MIEQRNNYTETRKLTVTIEQNLGRRTLGARSGGPGPNPRSGTQHVIRVRVGGRTVREERDRFGHGSEQRQPWWLWRRQMSGGIRGWSSGWIDGEGGGAAELGVGRRRRRRKREEVEATTTAGG